jgi:hypothetical protein
LYFRHFICSNQTLIFHIWIKHHVLFVCFVSLHVVEKNKYIYTV